MKRGTEIAIGQHFQDARITAFGARLRTVWIVDRVWKGSDGLDYARLVREDDRGQSKTVSASALADRKLFVPDVDRIREQVVRNSIGRRFRFFNPFSRTRKSLI